jgi:hypothetical protein
LKACGFLSEIQDIKLTELHAGGEKTELRTPPRFLAYILNKGLEIEFFGFF